jgi:ParB-like chromosome segregation protein Spo0J
MSEKIAIADIIIGDRHRKDMGDLDGLAKSIAELGLLHNIVVTADKLLIAGERRLKACQLLGWTHIDATTIDIDNIARGELAENTVRKDFLPSEIDAIRRTLEPVEKAAARERMTLGKRAPRVSKGRVRDKIAAVAGVSGRTVDRIKTVTEAADRDPERFAPLVEEMDRTNDVDSAYSKVRATTKPATPQRSRFDVAKTDAIALLGDLIKAVATMREEMNPGSPLDKRLNKLGESFKGIYAVITDIEPEAPSTSRKPH